MVLVMILFGSYRREYLSQAIPVYMQYLEQRDKWEHVNTGTYAYYSPPLNRYFFIKNNTLVKIMRYGNPSQNLSIYIIPKIGYNFPCIR